MTQIIIFQLCSHSDPYKDQQKYEAFFLKTKNQSVNSPDAVLGWYKNLCDQQSALKMTPLHQTGMQTSPVSEPRCMRHSQHHAVHKPRRVSPKSFSETSPEKTRWPHQLPWKSRDPCAVISSLKVTCDSLLGLATLPTLGTRSAKTLILFCLATPLLPFRSSHSLNMHLRGLHQIHRYIILTLSSAF